MNATTRIATGTFALLFASGMLVSGALPATAQGQSGTTLIDATKTAVGHYTRTFHWTIDKSVTPDTWNLFRGDAGTSRYTITVTKDNGTDEAWVDGQICVTNGGAVATENLQIVDELRNGVPPPNDLIATVNVDVSSNPILDPGETGCYSYRVNIPAGSIHPGGTYKNTANITITNHSGDLGTPHGPSPSATTILPSLTLVNDTIHVTDTNGGSFTFSSSNSTQYDKTFTCDADKGTHNNTATIDETGQSDSASVTVNCYALEVTKDASTTFKRTYTWDIHKSVTPDTWTLFTGDSGTSKYTVSVDKTTIDSDWAVSGHITVKNPAPVSAQLNTVSDIVSGFGAATVNCGVSFPYTLAAGGTLNCTYSANLPNADSRTNTATATLQNHNYNPDGSSTASGTTDFSGSAQVDFANATITEVGFKSVTVSDSYAGNLGAFGDDGSATYYRTFTCGGDAGERNNTATINETGQSSSAKVTVNCYALQVKKDAATSFTRTYKWTIDKSADQSALTLSLGQQFLVNYSIVVNASYVDGNYAVSGNIAVYNPAPIAATLNAVSDIVSGVGAATVNCGVSFPYSLAAGGTLNCTYSANLPNADSRTNTATATLQNHNYNHDGSSTASGTTDFSGSAAVNFSSTPTTEVDKCITVTDSFSGGPQGVQVCYPDVPKTFTYSRYIGPFSTCGTYQVTNTASFVTNNTQTTGSDSWTVNVNVSCAGGCTLTPGYWKTHSKYGPAPFDDLWATNGVFNEDTKFFLSGKTYYQVLWTPPQGNAYYILAHAYIAAKLNILNGASSTPQVDAAITYAVSLFNTYTPFQVSQFKPADRNKVISYAALLDQYNNGIVGPGHCTE